MRAETCSNVTCVTYTRKEVVAKEAIIVVFICDIHSPTVKIIEQARVPCCVEGFFDIQEYRSCRHITVKFEGHVVR
jgi:starvation-inducible outer membrane lipoprotein